ncbi:MAG: hypothetical protein D6780_01370, partial [Candidatus Dadabacteria bacterium]
LKAIGGNFSHLYNTVYQIYDSNLAVLILERKGKPFAIVNLPIDVPGLSYIEENTMLLNELSIENLVNSKRALGEYHRLPVINTDTFSYEWQRYVLIEGLLNRRKEIIDQFERYEKDMVILQRSRFLRPFELFIGTGWRDAMDLLSSYIGFYSPLSF